MLCGWTLGAVVLFLETGSMPSNYCGVRICLSFASKAGLVLTSP